MTGLSVKASLYQRIPTGALCGVVPAVLFSPALLTQDEESSGVVWLPFLGRDSFLLTVQAHAPTGDPETVEGGQLVLLTLRGHHR